MKSFNETLQDALAALACPTDSKEPEKGAWCDYCREVCEADGTNWCDRNKFEPVIRQLEDAHLREYDKYKDHINELNRQILVLKHEVEKRETYLCGYDPDEALVMQCGTCRFFQKKHSHCTHNDSLTNAKYKCSDWKFKTNEECAKEASKKHDEEIVRLRREIAELRKGISELLDALQEIYDEECTDYGTAKVHDKWRKALEGAKDE